MSKKKKLVITVITLILVVGLGVGIYGANYWNLLPKKSYTGEDFGITRVVSDVDYNENGIDDYMDIVLGARAYVDTKPSYDGAYYEGGYPPEEIGVCTDVIWNGLKGAGYCLKDMIDKDIEENIDAYWRVKEKPDKNIDFRRVPNIKVFLERNALSLTIDPSDIAQWQPGDIVTYGTNHIAIVSDKRNGDGLPYIIHNGGQPVFEEDALTRQEISGHYRFELSETCSAIPWKQEAKTHRMLVIEERSNGTKIVDGEEEWKEFLQKSLRGEPASIQLAVYVESSTNTVASIRELEYNKSTYTISWQEGGKVIKRTYPYLIERVGKDNDVAEAIHGFYLTHDNSLSYQELSQGLVSSQLADHIDFHILYSEVIEEENYEEYPMILEKY